MGTYPSLPLPPTPPIPAAHEQGAEHPSRSLRDSRRHILVPLRGDAAPLWHCSKAPREQLQDPPGNLLLRLVHLAAQALLICLFCIALPLCI